MPNPPKVIFKKDLQYGYDNDPAIVTTTAKRMLRGIV